jgi:hypothetical protein
MIRNATAGGTDLGFQLREVNARHEMTCGAGNMRIGAQPFPSLRNLVLALWAEDIDHSGNNPYS